jgi:hypothetical protein
MDKTIERDFYERSGTGLIMNREEATELELAADECRRAVEFFDRVQSSSGDEKIAVGRDHFDWLERAARRAAAAAPTLT